MRLGMEPPAEPIPAGRASPCWHIVAWFGTTAYPLSLAYDRANPGRVPLPYRASSRTVRDNGLSAVPCLAAPSLAAPCRARLSLDASASFPPTSCAGGGIRKLLSRVLLRACLGTHVAAQSPFRAFARPAVPSRPVFTSPVSRASFELSGRPLAPPTVSLRPSCRPNQLPPPGAFRLLSGWCAGCVRLPRSS